MQTTHKRWMIWFGAVLVLLAAGLHVLHWAIFGDWHHVMIYLVGDIAFVPLRCCW